MERLQNLSNRDSEVATGNWCRPFTDEHREGKRWNSSHCRRNPRTGIQGIQVNAGRNQRDKRKITKFKRKREHLRPLCARTANRGAAGHHARPQRERRRGGKMRTTGRRPCLCRAPPAPRPGPTRTEGTHHGRRHRERGRERRTRRGGEEIAGVGPRPQPPPAAAAPHRERGERETRRQDGGGGGHRGGLGGAPRHGEREGRQREEEERRRSG